MPTLPNRSFYYVRHGEAEAISQQTLRANDNRLLTEEGRDQARRVAEVLCSVAAKPDAVFYSDMSRTEETAKIILLKNVLPSHSMPGLREHNIGDWEGKPEAEITPKLKRKENPDNGESFEAFHLRLTGALRFAFDNAELPLIVGHGGLWHALAALNGHEAICSAANANLYFFLSNAVIFEFPWRVYNIELGNDGELIRTEQTRSFRPTRNRFSEPTLDL